MGKVLEILCIAGIFIALLSGCSGSNDSEKAEQAPITEEIIINEVHVTEQPLSEINTDEEDLYANALRDRFQYVNFGNNSNNSDGVCYGILTEDYQDYYIVAYQNGKEEKLFDDRIYYYYCNDEGIYYAIGRNIYFLNYCGGEPKLILEIPEEIYFNESESIFLNYKGSLWIGNYNTSKTDWPLINYDFNTKIFTKFDKGGLDAVNNGFFYFVDQCNDWKLYRFDCEKHTIQLVSDISDIKIKTFDFYNNRILYNDFESLYRVDSGGSIKILSADQIKPGTNILGVRFENNRIFVEYADDPEDFGEIEIDIDGNIINHA